MDDTRVLPLRQPHRGAHTDRSQQTYPRSYDEGSHGENNASIARRGADNAADDS